MTFAEYPVRLIDVSQFQDNRDTAYQPTFDKVVAAKFLGVGVRVGYGLVEDRAFKWFWEKARGILERKPYWYLDYYSHRGTSTTNRDWGIEQANVCYDLLKGDMGEIPLALDCEESTYGGKIGRLDYLRIKEFNEIARGFSDEWYRLTEKKCEIYGSGLLWALWDWAKGLDLWLARYNRYISSDEIIAKAKSYGFYGKVRIWQYASDGDIDGNGTADGYALGFESNPLDLNVFLGTLEEWSAYCGDSAGSIIEPPSEDDDEVEEPIMRKKEIGLLTVTCASGLNIRNTPKNYAGTKVIGWLVNGAEVEILEVKIIGADVWGRVGQVQWCAIKYEGINYMA